MIKAKNKVSLYRLNYRIDWGKDSYQSIEFHFLPMLRYLDHGVNDKMIQFRWFVWGVNIRIK